MSKKSLREEMPEIAAWIDSLREAFGKEEVDRQIKSSIKDGKPGFYARENGIEVGTPLPAPASVIIYHPVTGIAMELEDWLAEADIDSFNEFEKLRKSAKLRESD